MKSAILVASAFLFSLTVLGQPTDALQNWSAPPFWTPAAASPDNADQSGHSALAARRQALVTSPVPLPFVAITPCRQYNSLSSSVLADNTPRTVTLIGAPCAIPSDAQAVAANITVFNISGAGSNGVFRAGTVAPPTTAWINYPPTETQRANAGVLPFGAGGTIVVQVNQGAGSVDFVVDVFGYYSPLGVVNSLNGQVGDLTLVGGANVTLTPGTGTLSIAAGPLVSGLNGLTGAVNVAGTNGLSASAGGGTVTVTSNATSSSAASTIVSRDGTASFSAGTVTLLGNLTLPASSSVTAGSIFQGFDQLLHTAGANNLFLGLAAGNFSTSGTGFNAGLGNGALLSNGTGSYNTAVGASALTNNTAGSSNTAVGTFVLAHNTGGGSNTAIGFSALNNSTGSRNIAMGASAGYNLTTGSDNIDIGHDGVAGESNTIRIGKSGLQSAAYIEGIRGVTTVNADAIPVLIDSAGQLGTVSSSIRFKEDVRDMADTSAKLLQLRPVTFRYKAHRSQPGATQFGLIAEEVEGIMPELVARSADGEVETVMYQFLPSMLLNEYQKQQRTIEAQVARLDANANALRAQNDALRVRIEALEKLQQELLSELAREKR